MSLAVTVDDPAVPDRDLDRHFMRPAGIERSRKTLWGTETIAKRSPMLAEIQHDLHVLPDQFAEFERQCRLVFSEADQIAKELRGRFRRRPRDGAFLREYVQNFLDAIAFAREHKSERI